MDILGNKRCVCACVCVCVCEDCADERVKSGRDTSERHHTVGIDALQACFQHYRDGGVMVVMVVMVVVVVIGR